MAIELFYLLSPESRKGTTDRGDQQHLEHFLKLGWQLGLCLGNGVVT